MYDLSIGLGVSIGSWREIEQQYSSTDDRLRAVITTWLSTKEPKFWRTLISALDCAGETSVANSIMDHTEALAGMWMW